MRHAPLTKTTLRRISPLGSEVMRRATATWEAVKPRIKRAYEWWLKPRPSWWQPGQVWQWLNQRPQIGLPVVGIVTTLLLVAFGHWFWPWYSFKETDKNGVAHHPVADMLNPIGAALGGAVLVWAAFRQAWIAGQRHKEQTDADRQRRLTESFSKAVEQLAHADMAVRLGGIYTFEQISRESPSRYWTVMETLTAFVRERASWERTAPLVKERAYLLWEEAGRPDGRAGEHWRDAIKTTKPTTPPTDIAAVLTVIVRRDAKNRDREKNESWCFNLSGTDLRAVSLIDAHLEGAYLNAAHLEGAILFEAHLEGANLIDAHLEGAYLNAAHLEGAILFEAHLEGADLIDAHLEGADLNAAHLEGAILFEAHLEGADLIDAHLEGADLNAAHLEGANLIDAHLEGASLTFVIGLTTNMLEEASGNADTRLPDGVARPAHWPPAATEPDAGGAGQGG
jgi:uncharacterized protein YjbI with pentapeptide repeats